MRWDEFNEACPELADVAAKRFVRDQLVLVGTLRGDGWPRISPCEVDITVGHLFLGMMWHSTKAMDLLRDPRLIVHSVQCDREAARETSNFTVRRLRFEIRRSATHIREAIKARIDWAPDEPSFHLFSLDIDRAAFVSFGGGQRVTVWDQARGLRRWTKP